MKANKELEAAYDELQTSAENDLSHFEIVLKSMIPSGLPPHSSPVTPTNHPVQSSPVLAAPAAQWPVFVAHGDDQTVGTLFAPLSSQVMEIKSDHTFIDDNGEHEMTINMIIMQIRASGTKVMTVVESH